MSLSSKSGAGSAQCLAQPDVCIPMSRTRIEGQQVQFRQDREHVGCTSVFKALSDSCSFRSDSHLQLVLMHPLSNGEKNEKTQTQRKQWITKREHLLKMHCDFQKWRQY